MKNKLTLQLKKAFTLVELIVVVTILAIIWTIWFVSYTDYLSWVRDTNRTVQLESIWDWLKLSLTRWRLPIPDDYIEVKTNWNTIAYQGYAWEEVLKKIKYDKEGKDPLDNTYFSYYATDNRKNFQLMALLEETNETVSLFKGEVLSNDIDYADRQVKVSWKKLWILTGGWDNLNVPVQEIWEIKDNWELDIATTPDEYISHIDDSDKISWSWSELIKSIYNSSCKRILESSLDNWDWIYKINPAGTEEFEVYCDMSTDWGGWTLITRIITWLNYSWNIEMNNFSNSSTKHYWISRDIVNNLIYWEQTIRWYYKYYDTNLDVIQEMIYKLHNVRWNYASLYEEDKIYILGQKSDTAFILNFNGDSWDDFREPLNSCWYGTTFDQYWYESSWWNFTDHLIPYFSVYDWCTWGIYNQWATVINSKQSSPYDKTSWSFQELYIKF